VDFLLVIVELFARFYD